MGLLVLAVVVPAPLAASAALARPGGFTAATAARILAVCDLVDRRVTRVIPIGPVARLGRLQVGPDGRTLLGISDTGLALVRL